MSCMYICLYKGPHQYAKTGTFPPIRGMVTIFHLYFICDTKNGWMHEKSGEGRKAKALKSAIVAFFTWEGPNGSHFSLGRGNQENKDTLSVVAMQRIKKRKRTERE